MTKALVLGAGFWLAGVAAVFSAPAHADTGDGYGGIYGGKEVNTDPPTGVTTDNAAIDFGIMAADQLCAVVAANPSFDGIMAAATLVARNTHFTAVQDGLAVGEAINVNCTQYVGLLTAFINAGDDSTPHETV